MTDDEIRLALQRLRKLASEVGPLHGYWDIISDGDAILRGRRSILTRAQLVETLAKIGGLSFGGGERGIQA